MLSALHEIAGESFTKCSVPIEDIIVSITHRVLRANICWVQRAEKYGLIPQDEEDVECGVMLWFCVVCDEISEKAFTILG